MRLFGARFFATAIPKKPYSVLVFGQDEYTRSTLFSMLNHPNYQNTVKRLVTVAPSANIGNGAGQPLHTFLKEKQIEKVTFRVQFNSLEKYIKSQEEQYEIPFDLGIIASFNSRVPDKIMNLFPKGVIVAHPSLIPKYRGGSPIEHQIMNKELKTGVTILEASKEKIGSGKIMLQKESELQINDGYMQAAGKLGNIAGQSIMEILDDFDKFRDEAKPQPPAGKAPKAPLIGKTDAILLWDKLTVEQAVRKQMALYMSQMAPFTKIKLKGEWHYAFFDSLVAETDKSTDYYRKVLSPVEKVATPGVIHWSARGMKDKISVRCLDGWVSMERIKIEGFRANNAGTFISKRLRDSHFNEDNKFKFKFATSTDVIKHEEKIEI